MSPSLKTNITAILILSTLICANQAIAKDCYEKSPNWTASDDTYYDLDKTVTLTNEEQNKVNNLFNKVTGKWKGNITYIECRGPDSAPETKMRKGLVTAQIKSATKNSLAIEAHFNYIKDRIKQSESIELLGNSPVFTFKFIDDDHLSFSEKYRRMNVKKTKKITTENTASSNTETIINKTSGDTNAVKDSVFQVAKDSKNRTSRITESIYEINLKANTLTFTRSSYTNGVYTGEELWVLNRY